MKILMIFFLLLSTSLVVAQGSFTKKDAKAVIDAFFDGFHKGDTLIINKVVWSQASLQSASKNGKGENELVENNFSNFNKAIAARTSNQIWEEKILDYKVSIDGNLAHVWTPYEFYFNGAFSHCGANAFTLAKFSDGWKIVHLIDSRRKESCKASSKQ